MNIHFSKTNQNAHALSHKKENLPLKSTQKGGRSPKLSYELTQGYIQKKY